MPIINCSSPPTNWPWDSKRLTQLAAQFLSGKGHEPTKIDLVEYRVHFDVPSLSDNQLSVLIDSRWPAFRDRAIREDQK